MKTTPRRTIVGLVVLALVAIQRLPSADAAILFASDGVTGSDFSPLNGVFDQFQGSALNSAIFFTPQIEEQRFALEFNIAGLPAVQSATLRFFEISDDNVNAQLYGYSGDGVVQLSDLAAPTLLVGDIDDGVVGTNEIDVTLFLQSLQASNASFAGFMVKATVPGTNTTFPRYQISPQSSPDGAPELLVNVSNDAVPEPASVAVWSCFGLIGLAFRAARRSRS